MMEKLFAIFTDKNGNPELASIATIVLFGAFLYFGYNSYIILKHVFDPTSFGMGGGAIIAGGGGGKLLGNKGDYGA